MVRRVSTVTKYKPEEFTEELRDKLEDKAEEVLGRPNLFNWQLDAVESIFCGKDVIVNAGTGCGKSTVWELATLLHEKDIVLVVSPLSALMLDQV